MKAIKQIIDYLRERGELSRQQLTELAAQGLLAWHEVYVEESADTVTEDRWEEPPADEAEEEPPLREPIGRRGRGRPAKALGLKRRELCRLLAEIFTQSEANLSGLVQLGRLLGDCQHWSEAAIVVRNASPDDVSRAIEQGLRTHVLSLRPLWDFLAEEGFRTAIPEERLQGPAGSSYRALLAAAEPGHLGRHAALLHHEEIQKVFNLRMAQRQTVRAWAALYERGSDLVGRALKREDHWLAYWSMVILYTARRDRTCCSPEPAVHEDRPERDVPEPPRMQRAWAHAAVMDPLAVLPLLREHDLASVPLEGPELIRCFVCPRSWNRRYHGPAPQG